MRGSIADGDGRPGDTGPAADQFDAPAGPDPPTSGAAAGWPDDVRGGTRRRLGRCRADPPAGHGGRRRRLHAALRTPWAQQQSRRSGALGRQLQAAERHRLEGGGLPGHGCQSAAPEPFLQDPQEFGFAPGAHHDQPPEVEPQFNQTGTVEEARIMGPGAGPAPRHGAVVPRKARQHHGAEAGRRGADVSSGNLVQATPRQPAPRQGAVDRLDPQRDRRHRPVRDPTLPANPLNPCGKLGKDGRVGAGSLGHRRHFLGWLFLVCS